MILKFGHRATRDWVPQQRIFLRLLHFVVAPAIVEAGRVRFREPLWKVLWMPSMLPSMERKHVVALIERLSAGVPPGTGKAESLAVIILNKIQRLGACNTAAVTQIRGLHFQLIIAHMFVQIVRRTD